VSRPAVEVADILHAQGDTFLEQHPWLSVQQRSVVRAIARCRTVAFGGHLDRCDACGHQAISYNSCRTRHCPNCQAQARERWLHARERHLLDVPYVHVVFTLPHALLPLAYRNSARLYTWLFQTSAAGRRGAVVRASVRASALCARWPPSRKARCVYGKGQKAKIVRTSREVSLASCRSA
jgi:hypothetical protein